MDQETIERCFAALRASIPAPQTELQYATPFQLLVAVVLSAQSTDKAVNQCTARLFARAPDAQSLWDLGEEQIRAEIRHLGLFNTKARNVHALAGQILHQHGGEVPHDRKALEALPGVGRKTANVVLNTVFGEPTIAVDTHIFRLGNRLGIAPGNTPRAVEERLLEVVPEAYRRDAHHLLILHGRYVCTARRPRCRDCTLQDCCAWPHKELS
ncbi:endonuclease III [Candidatus Igneacidithiobacillus taiwanensis]|uniref:endonuclease III n=1 Tax=Candidatus Igneacidithiobacillus taiwanensis TaxID=1945924 RepID=UPI00289FAD21|nr:endonuclease III [Candidatus Igneacidithiobacillus taiwanensis]MCE5360630.1 endonuclease III [Acidithiobacillus sp.]